MTSMMLMANLPISSSKNGARGWMRWLVRSSLTSEGKPHSTRKISDGQIPQPSPMVPMNRTIRSVLKRWLRTRTSSLLINSQARKLGRVLQEWSSKKAHTRRLPPCQHLRPAAKSKLAKISLTSMFKETMGKPSKLTQPRLSKSTMMESSGCLLSSSRSQLPSLMSRRPRTLPPWSRAVSSL